METEKDFTIQIRNEYKEPIFLCNICHNLISYKSQFFLKALSLGYRIDDYQYVARFKAMLNLKNS